MSEQIINNEKLPLLITRGAVVFPNTYLNIDVGRLFSVAALQKSLDQCASKVIVSTQKDISINEPEANDVSLVGCLCNIDTVKEINGIFRIRVSALQRVKLVKVLDDEYNSHVQYLQSDGQFLLHYVHFEEKALQYLFQFPEMFL